MVNRMYVIFWGMVNWEEVQRKQKEEKKVQYLYMCITYYVRVLTSSGVDRYACVCEVDNTIKFA